MLMSNAIRDLDNVLYFIFICFEMDLFRAITKGDGLPHSSLKQNIDQDPYSPTILKYVLRLVLQNFLYLAAFECNETSDWLNCTVSPIRTCVTFKFTKSWRKGHRMFW